MTLQEIKNSLYQTMKTGSPRERRDQLITEMAKLNSQEIHCYNCTGSCCTMSANSMQVTPLEAFEIILSLQVTNSNLSELRNLLQTNIKNYRLDHEIFLGKKTPPHLRKTYTCPFFVPGAKGCSIKKELKPYGCLGFNPKIENDNGSQCHSDLNLLTSRQENQKSNEDRANEYLKNHFQLDWQKLEIPKAVLSLLNKIFNHIN